MYKKIQHLLLLIGLLPLTVVAEVADKKAAIPAPAPVDPLSVSSVLNMIMGLGLVIVLIFGMAWLVKRMGGVHFNASQKIHLLGGISLGPREKVVLLQVENKRLVVGVAQGQVNTLHVMEGEYEQEQGAAPVSGENFRDKLLQALQKKPQA